MLEFSWLDPLHERSDNLLFPMPPPIVHMFQQSDYSAAIQRAADVLREGKLVVLPTETVYGTAAVLGQATALAKLSALRQGSAGRPFAPHLGHPEQALALIDPPSDVAQRMMRKLWPGPVGLQFDVSAERRGKASRDLNVKETDLYDNASITLRCPDHPVFADVADAVGSPLVAAVAGAYPSSDLEQLSKELDGKVEMILDGGQPRFSKPSTLIKIEGNSYRIVRSGVYDERIIERLLRTTILYVCSGNTCRSPMAEAITRRLIADRLGVSPDELERKGFNILSAGSYAMPGSRATPEAVDAVRALGVDLTRHRSKPLSVELIHEADVIFAMGRGHAQAILSLVPGAASKVQTLDPEHDIEDPIGGSAELYNAVAEQMVGLITDRLREKSLP